MVSTNEKEKDLGLKMVDVVTKKGEFSTELIPVMMQYASGPRNDPNTQAALNILNNAATQSPKVSAEVASYTKGLPPTVYIQIATNNRGVMRRSLNLRCVRRISPCQILS
jgi:hypothetical protein